VKLTITAIAGGHFDVMVIATDAQEYEYHSGLSIEEVLRLVRGFNLAAAALPVL
jgi:hypothetical protein